ncbi:Serine/threonine-protein phosphatase 7 long form [Sesamum angolense]|uniref:Serine/threonine-protein phosphatase 7 long form n=1 Tax=Sesamum angolense TaxID=2727404 RepID=A0AAE2BV86_9LAMI|nr:Serine/threonine-protein phosphatase 7 long form [Sesamum angolense]
MIFLGILQCGHIEIDTHLITALVERWCPETHTFHFSVGEATVTLQYISIIWALPIEGNTVSLLYLRHMEIIDEERPSNWGTAVLAYLYRELSDLMPTVIDIENILPIPPYAARRGCHGENWAIFHRDYIVKWNDVQSMVVRPKIVNGRGTVPDYMNWYHQITRVQISHNIGSTDIIGYRPTDTRDWEYVYNRMEQLVLDCDNSGDDIQSLRETRARNRAIGRDIMTFSCAKYPSVRGGPAGDEAGPSNVYTPSGPSNVYNELVHLISLLPLVHHMLTLRICHLSLKTMHITSI